MHESACMSSHQAILSYMQHSRPHCRACAADLAVLVDIMVHHLPILLALVLDIIANV